MEIDNLGQEAYAQSVETGWYDKSTGDVPTFIEHLASIHCEIAEAHEAYRNGSLITKVERDENGKPTGIAVELADAVIRLSSMCAHFNIPLTEAINIKMAHNKTRPHRHGGKVI